MSEIPLTREEFRALQGHQRWIIEGTEQRYLQWNGNWRKFNLCQAEDIRLFPTIEKAQAEGERLSLAHHKTVVIHSCYIHVAHDLRARKEVQRLEQHKLKKRNRLRMLLAHEVPPNRVNSLADQLLASF